MGQILSSHAYNFCDGGDSVNRARKFLADAAGLLELPGDVLAGLPRMELVGFREFSIEPHKGLVEYEREQIIIETVVGRVSLVGRELTIRLMNSNRITVGGGICGVELLEG